MALGSSPSSLSLLQAHLFKTPGHSFICLFLEPHGTTSLNARAAQRAPGKEELESLSSQRDLNQIVAWDSPVCVELGKQRHRIRAGDLGSLRESFSEGTCLLLTESAKKYHPLSLGLSLGQLYRPLETKTPSYFGFGSQWKFSQILALSVRGHLGRKLADGRCV